MSVSYSPVLWNRQKRLYDWIMGGLMVLYLGVFVYFQLTQYANITPETLIIRATGSLSFLMLHVILCIGPLARFSPLFVPLLYNRRHLGVTTFLIGAVHGIFNLVQFHGSGDVNPLNSLFASNTHYTEYIRFPFQVLGFLALVILFLMAATSHDFWLKNLSPRTWKALHMMVYVAYGLLVFHVLLGAIELDRDGIFWMGSGILLVISMQTAGAVVEIVREQKRKRSHPTSEGYVEVCPVEKIPENRARIVQVGGEDIALFRYEGKVSAVNNACRHQNGPIGEGKIIQGCITCPWHGYQYYPQNGQSPPPFTEKLTTYDVKIADGVVFVHPQPYPEGTERPAAII